MSAGKIKGYLISLKHGFEMLDEAMAKGLPKEKKNKTLSQD